MFHDSDHVRYILETSQNEVPEAGARSSIEGRNETRGHAETYQQNWNEPVEEMKSTIF
jgi:hypothetical protein